MSSTPCVWGGVGRGIQWRNSLSSNSWFHYVRSVWKPMWGVGLKCHVLNSGKQHCGETILRLTSCFTKLQVFQSHARLTPKLLPCTQPCETTVWWNHLSTNMGFHSVRTGWKHMQGLQRECRKPCEKPCGICLWTNLFRYILGMFENI